MLVFIDDSGDPGFKLYKGSTPYFVMASVIFDDELEAEKAALAIKVLRRGLNLSDNFEFKFAKCSPAYRERFLGAVTGINFRVRAVVADKAAVKSPELRSKEVNFYTYMIKLALEHGDGIKDANIKLDGTADRQHRKKTLGYLKKELNSPHNTRIKKISFKSSHNNVLIQLADMVAGSINRSRRKDKKDSLRYARILKNSGKIENVLDFPLGQQNDPPS